MPATPAPEKVTDETRSAEHVPIVIDLGKASRKRVRALRRGEGPLLEDVSNAIEELRAAGTLAAEAQPVIVVVRQKRSRTLRLPFPLG